MITVEGKTLNQIAKESNVRLDCVQHRYSRGVRDINVLAKPTSHRKAFNNINAGQRFLNHIWKEDLNLTQMSRETGISRSTIYAFLYDGKDISSMRLAKLCSWAKVSMDEIMDVR